MSSQPDPAVHPASTKSAPPASAWPDSRIAWYSVAILTIAYAVAFLDRIVISLLVDPIKADLGISDTQVGMLAGIAFALFYTTLGVPIGWMADRYNRRNIISIGIALWSLATAACGLARGFVSLFLARIMVGVGEATLGPTSSSYIADLFPPKDRPKAYGFYVMGTAFGTGLALVIGGWTIGLIADSPSVTLPVLGELRSWQAVFLAVGLPGIAVALLMLTAIEPARKGRLSKHQEKEPSFAELLRFMASRPLSYAAIFVGPMFIFLAIYGAIQWQPSFFIRVHGWTPSQYGYLYGLFGMAAGIVSAASSGYVVSALAKRGRQDAPVLVMAAGTILVSLGHVAMPFMPGGYSALAAAVLGSIFVNWPSAAALTAINQITPNQMRARVTAIYYIVIGLGGLALGPVVIGAFTDYLFDDSQSVGWSVALGYGLFGGVAAAIMLAGRGAFRRSTAEAAHWEAQS